MTFAKKCVLLAPGNKFIRDMIVEYLPEHQLIPKLNTGWDKCRCEFCRERIGFKNYAGAVDRLHKVKDTISITKTRMEWRERDDEHNSFWYDAMIQHYKEYGTILCENCLVRAQSSCFVDEIIYWHWELKADGINPPGDWDNEDDCNWVKEHHCNSICHPYDGDGGVYDDGFLHKYDELSSEYHGDLDIKNELIRLRRMKASFVIADKKNRKLKKKLKQLQDIKK